MCIYCPHCTHKKRIIVNIYLWLNTQFIQEEYPGKGKAITRDKTEVVQQLKPVASLTKAVLFWGFSSVGVEGRWGDFHFLESCYIVAKDIKHDEGSLTYNCLKDADFVNWIQRTRTKVHDVGRMNLDRILWPHNFWWRYYCLFLHNSYFGVTKQFLAKIWLLSKFWVVSKEFFTQLSS